MEKEIKNVKEDKESIYNLENCGNGHHEKDDDDHPSCTSCFEEGNLKGWRPKKKEKKND